MGFMNFFAGAIGAIIFGVLYLIFYHFIFKKFFTGKNLKANFETFVFFVLVVLFSEILKGVVMAFFPDIIL